MLKNKTHYRTCNEKKTPDLENGKQNIGRMNYQIKNQLQRPRNCNQSFPHHNKMLLSLVYDLTNNKCITDVKNVFRRLLGEVF